jgi:hypothetical protein
MLFWNSQGLDLLIHKDLCIFESLRNFEALENYLY